MAILPVFHNFFRYYQNAEKVSFFAKIFCAIFCCICNGIYTLYIAIYVRYTQTKRFYFAHQRKTAILGKVNDYVLILARPGISILEASYPHFVFLYGYDYSYFRPKIATYSLKKLQYS